MLGRRGRNTTAFERLLFFVFLSHGLERYNAFVCHAFPIGISQRNVAGGGTMGVPAAERIGL
jgi:hypothetical protein